MTEEMRALLEKAGVKLDAARLLAQNGFFDDADEALRKADTFVEAVQRHLREQS